MKAKPTKEQLKLAKALGELWQSYNSYRWISPALDLVLWSNSDGRWVFFRIRKNGTYLDLDLFAWEWKTLRVGDKLPRGTLFMSDDLAKVTLLKRLELHNWELPEEPPEED